MNQIVPLEKFCPNCKQIKSIHDFHKSKSHPSGASRICKLCDNSRRRAYYSTHKEKAKTYRNAHKQKAREYNAQYRIRKNQELTEKRAIYLENNRSAINLRKKRFYATHKDTILKQQKEYRTKNPEKLSLTKHKHYTSHRLDFYLRSRIKNALQTKSIEKSIATSDLIGCSPAYLKTHLESKFQPGMSWDNYGFYGWHIDHIIPCASFDLSDPEQQKKCFHYTNLQPLWAKDNLSKGVKIL